MSIRNVVFFGSGGSGKSSTINMFFGGETRAPISSGAIGCTFESKAYETTIKNTLYRLYDTAGLDEGSEGKVATKEAMGHLKGLIRSLSSESGGVNLLVFVFRSPGRLTDIVEENYRTFYEGFCDKGVPIVMVVTGLEDEEPTMDNWWKENRGVFEGKEICFADVACITATRGRVAEDSHRRKNDEEYDFSVTLVKELLVKNCRNSGWRKSNKKWLKGCWKWIQKHFRPMLGIIMSIALYEAREVVVDIMDN
ncbi:hypothetical protein K435DRAFT_866672 [Dendrothele bispora CBS 962.96]|uniref:G domain-containing protein n=1 Tax=Dendrothele bispora (strain CBS 962.96) TaxID=1314807 RepID=A0A4V4HDP4_DENBC|nr:hypothetical protein K435DRAFT_866672 [Dendrothele bispora CBS 962.96]